MMDFDTWHTTARNEFMQSEEHKKGQNREFYVTQDGNVHLADGRVLEAAVTKYEGN